MNLRRFSFIAIILGLTTLIPMYAVEEQISEQTLTFRLESYFSIEKAAGSIMNGTIKAVNGTTLEMTSPIYVNYNVNTNDTAAIKISATVPVLSGTVNALYGTSKDNMTIVFSKSDGSAAASAIENASSTSASSVLNKNAVAFKLTVDTPTSSIGAIPNISIDDNAILYNFEAGTYNVPLKVEGSSRLNTYSSDDDSGEYKATLVLSKVDV